MLGDGVNLAARLYRSVGAIAFKGKTRPIEVFTLLGDRSQPAPAWLAKYHDGIRLYRARQFAAAVARFQEAESEIGGEDYFCRMYVERCNACQRETVPPDWDGSFALTEK